MNVSGNLKFRDVRRELGLDVGDVEIMLRIQGRTNLLAQARIWNGVHAGFKYLIQGE